MYAKIKIRGFQKEDIKEMITIWNEVVWEGIAFPQEEYLSEITGKEFFTNQSYCGIAEDAVSGRT